jgi:hypothetical protein
MSSAQAARAAVLAREFWVMTVSGTLTENRV